MHHQAQPKRADEHLTSLAAFMLPISEKWVLNGRFLGYFTQRKCPVFIAL